MASAKFTPEQLSEFLKSSKLVDMSTPISELMDSVARLPMDDDAEASVHILIATDYAVVTKVEEEVQ